MSSANRHLAQARGNEAFYADIGADASRNPDWAMTVLFYSAVHYVQAGLVHEGLGKAPANHKERKAAIARSFKAAWPFYSRLYQSSVEARYECEPPTPGQLRESEQLVRMVAAEVDQKAPTTEYR